MIGSRLRYETHAAFLPSYYHANDAIIIKLIIRKTEVLREKGWIKSIFFTCWSPTPFIHRWTACHKYWASTEGGHALATEIPKARLPDGHT